jgi:malate dehydrogenase
VMSVSTCPQGEYNCSRVSIGVPVVLGKNGIEKIIDLRLSEESKLRFEKSVSKIEETIASLNY